MKKVDIVRALRDRDYFESLTEEEKALVREANPIGAVQLDDAVLTSVSGGLVGKAVAAATGTGSTPPPPPPTWDWIFVDSEGSNCNCNC
ncbi:MAG TPA: mersacidin/lichenicidin family type 2 lantibiotic [Thermoanaerobaculia bacterium]|nr:mersacidin/lichenicidin family type 2 lantibiotic [Thermoanaerobaculia bacterium]